MTDMPEIRFVALDAAVKPFTVVLLDSDLGLTAAGKALDTRSSGQIQKALRIGRLTSGRRAVLDLLVPSGLDCERLLLVAPGDSAGRQGPCIEVGGYVMGQLSPRKAATVSILADQQGMDAGDVADLALGAILRSYQYRRFKTRPNGDNGEAKAGAMQLFLHCRHPQAAAEAFERRKAVAAGVFLARDLVNEPANTLGPAEFAEAATKLVDDGVDVRVLGVPELESLGMRALLGVGQGSARPSRVVVMSWNGGENKRARPVAFVGKGVTFDTGGISLKPAKGMEDMKGDMGGAACVTGLMRTLARRKAGLNALGLIGLVENMPSGTAQRPGDIVTSMSGQTIEVLNTDAEGRLVLADLLHYVQHEFRPRAIVDLATLTGAIMVALGKEYAGLFSNNDRLAGWLAQAGEATGERVWRMPLDPAYDKELDSKIADIRNIGGQYGGAITAAHFLQRFIQDTPWAHLDIAGVAMSSNRNEINESWGSGYGVRLLDRLASDHYEG